MLSKRLIRRLTVACLGGVIVLVGLLLWITPIPAGFVLVPTGLLVLASEFHWARRVTEWIKRRTGPVGRSFEAAEHTARRRLRRTPKSP